LWLLLDNQGYELQLRNSTLDSSTLAYCANALIDCVDLGDFRAFGPTDAQLLTPFRK
jgi:hypothetical protein